MKNCSLVISTYNWPEALDVCLKSVMEQSILPKDIVIADDGSDDRTTKIIASYQLTSPVEIVHVWQEDIGFRKSIIMNKAILKAKEEYIVQIDGDVILDRHFIADHLYVAESGYFVRGTRSHIAKEQVEAVLKAKETDIRFFSTGVVNRFNAIRIPYLSWLVTKKRKSGQSVRGCNMAFWKADFKDVNGYNNDLRGWGHEDEELATRLVNHGIIKKAVKFRCIQYHLYHELASRDKEESHNDVLWKIRESGITRCKNGCAEV
ncbi:glycosyltransferase family 2 protein [Sphingobacterium chuzhouense]|uniref:Glycosyltransferase family 2 protein n=1 Tax=Sphingobacterium chuzhouense TaxID=1742264 RepID=A0ABR7XM39_9SPHI|nr:glycosyltransferase family 2 protein [Sphingobacterium chuzhouense]MBD1420237.1 glycosyltransferase family 2 protein [Sphingobacterium chuzhouense]